MKENAKIILILNCIIFITCYIIASIFNLGDYGNNFIASIFITIVFDLLFILYILVNSYEAVRVIGNCIQNFCSFVVATYILLVLLTPLDACHIPEWLQVIIVISGVILALSIIYRLIFYSEQNIPKSGLHPNTDKVVDEKVR